MAAKSADATGPRRRGPVADSGATAGGDAPLRDRAAIELGQASERKVARAIAGDQLLQITEVERALYWLDRFAGLGHPS